MCFIIAVVLVILSYNFFMANNIALAIGSFLGSGFFIFLMIKNILHVKNLKKDHKGKEK
ncbi:MAG: hypothetical protein PHX13_03420 [Thiovulaceae bacterium]|nr:hypothetical protein [Sulfurimonadaceae bacterium]